MLRNTSIRFILIAASAAVLLGAAEMQTAPSAPAQNKLAVINMQQAVLNTAEIKKASADLEAKYKPRQAELQKLQTDLNDIQQKLQAGQGKLSPAAESQLNDQGKRVQRDLQRKSQDLQEEVDAERNDILQRTGQRMQGVVRKLAEERGLDVVVDASSTLYTKPALDLTNDAVAAFDKAYPVK